MRTFPGTRLGVLDVLALAVVTLVGLVNLPLPFHGDQALFTVAARQLSEGAVLYRDFWDVKQPGIFGFYLLGGTLFGFHEIGVHLFELLYLVTFSAVLVVTLKGYYRHPALAALVPLLTVGVYYGVAGAWHLTQVEALVGFPVYFCLWFASTPPGREGPRAARLFLSGLMGGIVLLFKLLFLPILAAFWGVALVEAVRARRERFVPTLARVGAPVALGVLCVVLPAVGYFAWFGTLDLLYQTWFEYPPRMVVELPGAGYGNLLDGLFWFARTLAPLLALGFAGAFLSLGRRRESVTLNLVLWVLAGLVVILLQRRSWWAYHYLLLLVPLGVLAVRALDLFWVHLEALGPPAASRKNLAATTVGLALLFSPVVGGWARKGVLLALGAFSGKEEHRLAYQRYFGGDYAAVQAEVAFLTAPGSRPGDIYVCGNPLYYYLSDRRQAVSLNGWALELYLHDQWEKLTRQLAETRPPYVFVDVSYTDLIPERSPATSRFLEDNYRVLRQGRTGVWYVLKGEAAGTVPRPARGRAPAPPASPPPAGG